MLFEGGIVYDGAHARSGAPYFAKVGVQGQPRRKGPAYKFWEELVYHDARAKAARHYIVCSCGGALVL